MYSKIVSTVALVLALMAVCLGGAVASGKFVITSSKQIRNGAVTSLDVKNGSVRSTDVADGTVSTADIGADQVTDGDIGPNQVTGGDIAPNQVTPEDVVLPPVEEVTLPQQISGVVSTSGFTKIADVGTYTKVQAESGLEVTWSGAVQSGPSTNCVFQVRASGGEPTGGGGEVFSTSQAVNVSTAALFTTLPAGDVHLDVYAMASQFVSGGGATEPTCVVGGAVDSTFLIGEAIE